MTQPNKLAVQYLLNDEPSGGSSERCQPRNRYREPGRHGQLVTVTDCHPSAGSIAYEETQVMLKYGSRNCSGTLRKHEKYVTEFPKGDFNIERYNDLVHQSCRPSISTSASAPTQSPAQDRASVRSSSMSGCGQLRLSVPSLPKAAVKRAASTQFQQFRPNPTLEQMRSTLATTTSLSSDQVGHQRLSSSPPRYTTGGPSSHIPITSSLCMTRQQAEQNQRATEGRKFKCKVCGKIFVEKGKIFNRLFSFLFFLLLACYPPSITPSKRYMKSLNTKEKEESKY